MMKEDNAQDRLASEAPAVLKRPPRSERKRKRHEELLLQKREKRKRKKIEKKLRAKEGSHEQGSEDRKKKKERKEEIQKRLCVAMDTGQRICIDCGLEEYMIDKEKTKLAMQIGRVYGSNRRADNPVHLYISGIDKHGILYQECVRINDGFQNYFIDVCERSHTELFPLDSIIYLSPDSDKLLKDIDSTKIYVIGGLVDESIKKEVTKTKAESAGIMTARLPIAEYLDKTEQPNCSQILSVNQVFDILLTYISTQDWAKSLATWMPKRKGYMMKTDGHT